MPERRILFVDDDPNILGGLRRMLRSQRRIWDMQFVEDGPTALAAMVARPADVLVTDMRMPGMDGGDLLQQVMAEHPQTVRLVLSGQAARETILDSLDHMHRYLSKPCDAPTLKQTLHEVCDLDIFLPPGSLRTNIMSQAMLAQREQLYQEMTAVLQSPSGKQTPVGPLLSCSPDMDATNLLSINLAFHQLRPLTPVAAQAMVSLSVNTLKVLGLSTRVFGGPGWEAAPPTDVDLLGMRTFWRHSLVVAEHTRRLAETTGASAADTAMAFAAGLFHDIGKLVLAATCPADYHEVQALRHCQPGMSLLDAETAVLGSNHAAVGAFLLGLWGLPQPVVQAVYHHHQPAAAAGEAAAIVNWIAHIHTLAAHNDQAALDRPGASQAWTRLPTLLQTQHLD